MKVLYRGQLLDFVKIEEVKNAPLQDANGRKIELRYPDGQVVRTDLDLDPGFSEPLKEVK